MLYSKGEVEDEELHKKFHNKLIDGIQFSVSLWDLVKGPLDLINKTTSL